MSFKKNALSNYCGHLYSTLISILIVPLYLHYLGAAAFGLISVFVVMQAWLSLLNMGFVPALSREVTCSRSQRNGFLIIWQLLRSLEIIFLIINLVIIIGVALSSYWIAHHWLKVRELSYSEVIHCLILMGIITCFRFFADLYRAGILSMEEQVWLNGASVIFTTLRYVGAYFLLRFVTKTP